MKLYHVKKFKENKTINVNDLLARIDSLKKRLGGPKDPDECVGGGTYTNSACEDHYTNVIESVKNITRSMFLDKPEFSIGYEYDEKRKILFVGWAKPRVMVKYKSIVDDKIYTFEELINVFGNDGCIDDEWVLKSFTKIQKVETFSKKRAREIVSTRIKKGISDTYPKKFADRYVENDNKMIPNCVRQHINKNREKIEQEFNITKKYSIVVI